MTDARARRVLHDTECLCDDCLAEAYGYDWRDLVPGMGWLRDWVQYGLDCTDAPPIFHIGSGLVALATVVGAHCTFVPTPGDKPYSLNLWVLTAGSSAKARKTTSVNMLDELLEARFSYMKVPWAGSPEAVFSKIALQPQCVMIVPEFPSMLAQMNQKYAQSMKTQMMDLFDGKNVIKTTRGKGDEIIANPRVSLIGAGALDLLDKHLQEIDFRSGFLSRMLFIADDRKKRHRRAKQYPDRLKKLQDDLFNIGKWATQIGTITASTRADDALDSLCREVDAQTNTATAGYQSLVSRNELHAHKLAALYSASVHHANVYGDLVIKRVAPIIAHAAHVITTYLVNMMSQSEYVRAAHCVKEHIREHNYEVGTLLTYKEIVQATLDVKHAEQGLAQLLAEEILTTEYITPTEIDPDGPPKALRKVYRLKTRDF